MIGRVIGWVTAPVIGLALSLLSALLGLAGPVWAQRVVAPSAAVAAASEVTANSGPGRRHIGSLYLALTHAPQGRTGITLMLGRP